MAPIKVILATALLAALVSAETTTTVQVQHPALPTMALSMQSANEASSTMIAIAPSINLSSQPALLQSSIAVPSGEPKPTGAPLSHASMVPGPSKHPSSAAVTSGGARRPANAVSSGLPLSSGALHPSARLPSSVRPSSMVTRSGSAAPAAATSAARSSPTNAAAPLATGVGAKLIGFGCAAVAAAAYLI